MKRIAIATLLSVTIIMGFSACSKQESKAKNMEQIYKEEGVPVRTVRVTPRPFQSRLSYNAVLSGIKEATAGAAFGGRIDKVYVKVGDRVKKDQVLLSFPTDTPATRYYQSKVAYENARTAYNRIENLYKAGGISLQERDNAKARFDVAKADWFLVRQLVKVKAPISGYVSKVYVAETDGVEEKMPLVTIAKTDKLKAIIWVSDDEIEHLNRGMTATATWKDRTVEGRVTQVDLAMNRQRRAFRAQVEFDNNEEKLKAGTTVDISITTYTNDNAIVVKREHLKKEGEDYFVYTVSSGKARKTPVTTGRRSVLDVEISGGLKAGDELVVEGALLLEDGVKVNVIKNNIKKNTKR